MDLYDDFSDPMSKRCKGVQSCSLDGKLIAHINYELFPYSGGWFVGLCLETPLILCGPGNGDRCIENDSMFGETRSEFKQILQEWIDDHKEELNLSRYATKRLIMWLLKGYKAKR